MRCKTDQSDRNRAHRSLGSAWLPENRKLCPSKKKREDIRWRTRERGVFCTIDWKNGRSCFLLLFLYVNVMTRSKKQQQHVIAEGSLRRSLTLACEVDRVDLFDDVFVKESLRWFTRNQRGCKDSLIATKTLTKSHAHIRCFCVLEKQNQVSRTNAQSNMYWMMQFLFILTEVAMKSFILLTDEVEQRV